MIFFITFYCSNTVVSIFPPLLSSTPLTLTSHSQYYPSLALSVGPLYMLLDDPFHSFPHHLSLPSPLVTVSLFFISMFLVIVCLLVCFVNEVPLIGEIIWYFSFTTWLISLSIVLSSSIHAVAKGRSSFFLSAA